MAKVLRDGRAIKAPDYGLWIDGERRKAASGAVFTKTSPYDGTLAATFANGDLDDAAAAIAVAREVFDSGRWSRSSARERFKVLMGGADIVSANAPALADSMVRESGKPRSVALAEIDTAIRTLEFYAGAALDIEGAAIGDRVDGAMGLILPEPVGVAGFITPWNFPILNPTVKIAPALAAGCTIVIKPSHLCSGPVVLLAQYLSEAGLPKGVLNVVTSDIERGAEVGQAIASSALVDKIAFTGSTRTGVAVSRAAAETHKRVSLELGGKSPNIVFEDAPLEEAAKTSARAFCHNSGQQCSAATRLLVQDSIHDEFVTAVVEHTRSEVLGDPNDLRTTMGPMVSEEQFARVKRYIELGGAEGELVIGGGRPSGAEFAESLFVTPTIFDRVESSATIAQEEIFGPVLSVIPFKTEADAIRIANDSRYGLAGGVWTRSIDMALRVVKAVRTGKMFVNSYNNSGLDDLPHGGYRQSGIGREQGRRGLDEYQEVKAVHIKLHA